MAERLLGGPGFEPATDEQKRKFKAYCANFIHLNDEELRDMQYIEWRLTLGEYTALKFGLNG